MKSFFKKLAFVMAMAMVVSMAAPAAQRAAAATAVRIFDQNLNTEVTGVVAMEVGQEEVVDLCFKDAPPEWRDYTWGWATSNPAVAVVDKNGVVIPVGAGTATITLVTDCDVTAAPVTVTVTGAAKDVAIGTSKTDIFTEKEVVLGDEEVTDLNFYGVTDWNGGRDYKVQWVSSDMKVAKVDGLGRIEPVAPGKTNVTFIGTNTVTHESYVGNVEITVIDPDAVVDYEFTAEQVDTKTIKLTFAEGTDMSEATKADFVFLPVDSEGVSTGVVDPESIEVDGNVVTVIFAEDALKAGTTLYISGYGNQNNVAIVGPEEKPVDNSFTAKQTKDNEAVLTFANTEITKADLESLESGLVFYYYVGDTEVTYPIQIDSVKDGVVVVKPYVSFTDGIKYGFKYGEESDEFVASVGEAVSISYTWKCDGDSLKAYVGTDTTITCVLLDAHGIDVTESALARNGASLLFTLEEEAKNGEFWISNAGSGATGQIYFNEKAVAKVQVEYITGKFTETTYEPIPGPKQSITITSSDAPAYGINVSAGSTATITTNDGFNDWGKASTIIALGDDNGHKLMVKMKDTKGNDVFAGKTETGLVSGAFSFATTNNSILYVDDSGLVMTNGTGTANVLVYFTPAGATSGTVVAVASVNVRPTRAVTAVSVDKASDVVSTEAPYNKATFTITLTDQLNDKIDVDGNGTPDVTCNNADRLPNGAEAIPDITTERSEKGVYKVTILGAEANLPQNANGYSYTFTVKVGNITRTFSVTVRKPLEDTNGNLIASGYRVEFGGDDDLKTEDGSVKAATATLYILSNGVKAAIQSIEERPATASGATSGKYYYTVTKGGQKIELKQQGNSISIPLTGTKTETASSSTLKQDVTVVNKGANGTGSYTVVVYQAVGGTTSSASATAFRQVASNTVTVKDSQDTMSYAGRKSGVNSYGATSDVEKLVTDCFKFKLGNDTFDNANVYDEKGIIVVANVNKRTDANGVLISGSVCFVKNVTFYVPAGNGVYVKYTVTVNDYIEIQ